MNHVLNITSIEALIILEGLKKEIKQCENECDREDAGELFDKIIDVVYMDIKENEKDG